MLAEAISFLQPGSEWILRHGAALWVTVTAICCLGSLVGKAASEVCMLRLDWLWPVSPPAIASCYCRVVLIFVFTDFLSRYLDTGTDSLQCCYL